VRAQEAFHVLDGQNRNKVFDLCALLKLVCRGAQHLFNLRYRTPELFTERLHEALPLHWRALERHAHVRQICT
jgi:hypothetical protein